MDDEFSVQQAADLARYFLGHGWLASQRKDGMRVLISAGVRGMGQIHVGTSWRSVFRSAGVTLPLRSQYTAQGLSVMHNARAICTAVSATMAKRISAALNNHVPDRRGI